MKIKEFVALGSVAILALGFAACSNDTTEEITPTIPPTTSPTQIAPTPTAGPLPTQIVETPTPVPTAVPIPTSTPTIVPTPPEPTKVPPTQVPATSTPEPTAISYPAEFSFVDNFESDLEDWTTGFADLPIGWTDDLYELDSGFTPMPEGLDGNGIFLQGHNRSDDLFMYITKQITGLKPNTNYEVHVAVDLATNIPGGLMGIGGSPGESVYVKTGATTNEPVVEDDGSGQLRVSIDKGNQASNGSEMVSIGNVAHSEVVGSEFRIKTLENTGQTVTVPTDDQGRLWMVVGTDSGFEGLSTFYYSAVRYQLTIAE